MRGESIKQDVLEVAALPERAGGSLPLPQICGVSFAVGHWVQILVRIVCHDKKGNKSEG